MAIAPKPSKRQYRPIMLGRSVQCNLDVKDGHETESEKDDKEENKELDVPVVEPSSLLQQI